MGKRLIIKGADFSLVAVNKEDTKPVDFINLAGFGSKNKDHYNIGDTYYTISDGEGLNNASFNKKTSESEVEILNFEDGKIIKIDDVFFSVINAEGKPCLKPKYGLEEIKYTEGVGHTNTNGAVTEVNNDAVKGGVIPIVANTPYYIFGYGGSSFILAFVKKQNGEVKNLSLIGSTETFIKYVPTEDETLYFSYNSGKKTPHYVVRKN